MISSLLCLCTFHRISFVLIDRFPFNHNLQIPLPMVQASTGLSVAFKWWASKMGMVKIGASYQRNINLSVHISHHEPWMLKTLQGHSLQIYKGGHFVRKWAMIRIHACVMPLACLNCIVKHSWTFITYHQLLFSVFPTYLYMHFSITNLYYKSKVWRSKFFICS